MTLSRGWKIALGVVFYGLLAVVLARYLRGTDWAQLARLDVSPLYLLAALPLSLAPRFLQPVAWRVLIRGYGERPPAYAQLTRIYATSWLGRYIPGKLAWIGAKVYLGRDHGMGAAALAATAVAEAGIQLATALALALALVAAGGAPGALDGGVWLLGLAALALMSVVLLPPVFNALASRAGALLRRSAPPAGGGRLSGATLVETALLYVGIHALSGLPIYLVLRSVHPATTVAMIPELTAAFLLAGTIGTLAVFAPSGLGVREGILLVLLGLLVPRHVAVVAVVVLRLWSIAMDVVFYVLAVVVARSERMRT